MTKKQKFKSDAFAAIHSSSAGLQRVGAIDQTTMREFDETCLAAPVALAPFRSRAFASKRTSANLFLQDTSTPVNPPFKSGNLAANNPAAWRSNYWPWCRDTDWAC
jgi:putative transcriptional regulator